MEQANSEEIILNVKKPRFGKKGYISSLLNKNFLNKFRNNNQQYKQKTDKEILKDWLSISKGLYQIILEEPDGLRLGENMGELKLGLLRIHNVINRKESNLLGKTVKYSNSSTNNKPGKIIWRLEFAKSVDYLLRYLGFTPIRWAKTKASDNMLKNGNIYKNVTEQNKHK